MTTRRALFAAMLAAPAAARAQPSDDALRRTIRRVMAEHIIPGANAFAEAAQGFATATANPVPPDGARAAWVAVSLAFQRIRHLRFGPLDEFDRGLRIDFFPDVRNSIGREMGELLRAADPAQVTPEAFQHGRVAAQGLPAAERLLFGDDAPRLAAPDQPFRRVLLAAIGVNLATMGDAMRTEWQSYGPILEGTPTGGYRIPQDGMLVLFKTLVGGLEFLAERQVARVLGPSAREAFPRRAEAWRSGESLALVRASLAAQQNYWATGFAPMLIGGQAALAREVTDGFAQAEAAAARITPSLEVAVVQNRAPVEELLRILGPLRRLIADRVSAALDLPVGFNSMDGD
ncbi:imelysin family protein [Roseomonas sp. HJA6]|uniref:Imelysin family protein n=1 Tax=Roseomonas alba TaxID=2846776 RepID=A0ABS7AEJ4_9PROT|nr:imelysin family protein [Neoroseomonas alba]MBW6400721.1 imelysin family protein [Neoroseomonas alba]